MSATTARTPVATVLKRHLKKLPILLSIRKYFWHKYCYCREKYWDVTRLNICDTFPLYTPQSTGKYKDRSQLTIQSINETIPLLGSVATSISHKTLSITDIRSFAVSKEDLKAAMEMKEYFHKYGSDKGDTKYDGCGYYNVYGPILKRRDEIRGVLEIGIGTNNIDVVSNMGTGGKPGASLKAFRDFLQSAKIFGADIDKRCLFEDARIKTFFVDQTNPATFTELGKVIPSDLDLIIDDGLHSPNANIETLKFGLTRIRSGGWMVVEDIGLDAFPVWEVVSALLPNNYKHYMFYFGGGFVFAVQR